MALTTIDDYTVMYSANQFPPRIFLQAKNKFIGQLIFMPDNTPLPPDKVVSGQVNLYYHLENFPHALDLLETDTKVSLLFNGSGPGFENGLLTASENVGDDEVKQMLAQSSKAWHLESSALTNRHCDMGIPPVIFAGARAGRLCHDESPPNFLGSA